MTNSKSERIEEKAWTNFQTPTKNLCECEKLYLYINVIIRNSPKLYRSNNTYTKLYRFNNTYTKLYRSNNTYTR